MTNRKTSIYLVHHQGSACYLTTKGVSIPEMLRTRPASDLEALQPLELEWSNPDTAVPDIAHCLARLVIDPNRHPELAAILSRSGSLLPLGGAAQGRSLHIPFETTAFKDLNAIVGKWDDSPIGPTSQSDVKHWAFDAERLPINTMLNEIGLGKIAVEEDSNDSGAGYRSYGLRALVKEQNLTGVLFKRIWSSYESVTYDRYWLHDAIDDPSLWD